VLEIAVGTGLNLPYYADGVRLTGIEFVPAMLDIARRRAVELARVRSPARAVRGVQRLLAPGLLRFGADHVLREPLEHVPAEGFSIELLERSKLGLVERLVARKPRAG
jgi:hypothetical protein